MNVKKPNAIIYFLAYIVLMPFLKIFFRLKVDKSGYNSPKGPFIAISNHASFMDFAVTMLALYPKRVNAVAAQKFFYYSPLHRLLPMMGAIPKCLFDADARAIICIKKVLSRGDNILLFPEGRCECDGVYAGMHKATGKLLKKLSVPVVSLSVDGAYNCMPFWRKGLRFGRVRVIVSDLFSVDDLKSLSVDEINDAVDKRLSRVDDPPAKTMLGTKSKKKLAEGAQNMLYWCPSCGNEFTTQTKGCEIICVSCGYTTAIDGYMNLTTVSANDANGKFLPSTFHEWFKMQAQYEAKKLHNNMEPVVVNVQVRLPAEKPGAGMETCGQGIMRMDPDGWHFDGILRDEETHLHFPFNIVPAIPIDPDDVFQIYAQGVFYCFVPERTRECVKYSVIGECAYWKFSKQTEGSLYMTPREDGGFC